MKNERDRATTIRGTTTRDSASCADEYDRPRTPARRRTPHGARPSPTTGRSRRPMQDSRSRRRCAPSTKLRVPRAHDTARDERPPGNLVRARGRLMEGVRVAARCRHRRQRRARRDITDPGHRDRGLRAGATRVTLSLRTCMTERRFRLLCGRVGSRSVCCRWLLTRCAAFRSSDDRGRLVGIVPGDLARHAGRHPLAR